MSCVDCKAPIVGIGQKLIRCDDCLFLFILNFEKGN